MPAFVVFEVRGGAQRAVAVVNQAMDARAAVRRAREVLVVGALVARPLTAVDDEDVEAAMACCLDADRAPTSSWFVRP